MKVIKREILQSDVYQHDLKCFSKTLCMIPETSESPDIRVRHVRCNRVGKHDEKGLALHVNLTSEMMANRWLSYYYSLL